VASSLRLAEVCTEITTDPIGALHVVLTRQLLPDANTMTAPITTPAQRQLAEAMQSMRERRTKGRRVFQSSDFTRT